MTAQAGSLALWLGLAVTGYGLTAVLLGIRRPESGWVASARGAVLDQFAGMPRPGPSSERCGRATPT